MKQHLSEPRPGAETVMEKRAHADRCKALPPDLPDDVDLMIEVSCGALHKRDSDTKGQRQRASGL